MINVDELNAYLARARMSRVQAAKAVGVTPKTFYSWMTKRSMPTEKAEILIKELNIKKPSKIFFDGELPAA